MTVQQFLSLFFEFSAVIAGFWVLKHLEKDFKILLAFVVFAFITDLSIFMSIKLWNMDTRPALHFYVPVEFLFLALFYLKQYAGFIKSKPLIIVMVIFIMYCILNVSFIQNLYEYSNARSVGALILVVFSIIYFYKIMVETKVQKLVKEPMVWINTGVLLYFSGSFFFHVLFNLALKNSISFTRVITTIFMGLNISFYFFIAIGFITKRLYSKKEFSIKKSN